MDVNGSSTCAGKDGALPCVAQFVNILLVDHDTTSLMSLVSQFEHQLYKVTPTESAKIALALFQERSNYYDIVIANIGMTEMGIYEFVQKLHGQRMTVPVILIAGELTMDLAREAIGNGVCYVFSKHPSHRDISNVWQHIPRVTGKMPALSEKTNYIDIERDCNPSSAAINQKQKNLKINTDKEIMKRKKNQTAETSNSSRDSSMKPRLAWTSHLHKKFLQAISVLGEHGAKPKRILRLMNEPNLTASHVNSHFQNYRKHRRQSLKMQKTASPVMPAVFPAAPLNTVVERQTYDSASPNTTAAPNSVQVQNQDPFNCSGKNSVNTMINNDGFGNAGNLGEGTNSSNQQFDGMLNVDDVNQFLQELEASGVNIWDMIN